MVMDVSFLSRPKVKPTAYAKSKISIKIASFYESEPKFC